MEKENKATITVCQQEIDTRCELLKVGELTFIRQDKVLILMARYVHNLIDEGKLNVAEGWEGFFDPANYPGHTTASAPEGGAN